MKPSIGRIVHYVSYGTPGGEYTSQCRAAIIAGVPGPGDSDSRDVEEPLDLVVLNPTGMFFNRCPHHELPPSDGGNVPAHRGGSWHWPERVD